MAADPLVGSWKLVSWRNVAEDGTFTDAMGADPVGFIIYSNDGHIAAHLAGARRLPFAGNDMAGGTPAEDAAAMKSHISYVGTYTFHGDHVIHRVVLSSFPNWSGSIQRRQCTFDGNRLLLVGDPMSFEGGTVVAHALWERAAPQGA